MHLRKNRQVRYLSAEELLQIHSIVIDETGGSHGVRDLGQVEGAAKAPAQTFGGKELYPDLFSKAAVYLHSAINHHSFIDGNKRTAVSAAGIFLELNNTRLQAKEGELEKLALRCVAEKLEILEIAKWLKGHSQKI